MAHPSYKPAAVRGVLPADRQGRIALSLDIADGRTERVWLWPKEAADLAELLEEAADGFPDVRPAEESAHADFLWSCLCSVATGLNVSRDELARRVFARMHELDRGPGLSREAEFPSSCAWSRNRDGE